MFERKIKCSAAVEPACEYCLHGEWMQDHKMIRCPKRGAVRPGYRCRRFEYDPLQRVPKRQPRLPQFDPEDFSLKD